MGDIIRTEGVLQLERACLGHHAPSCLQAPTNPSIKSPRKPHINRADRAAKTKNQSSKTLPVGSNRVGGCERIERRRRTAPGPRVHPDQNQKTDTRSIRGSPPIGGNLGRLMEELRRNARDSPDLAGLGWWGRVSSSSKQAAERRGAVGKERGRGRSGGIGVAYVKAQTRTKRNAQET